MIVTSECEHDDWEVIEDLVGFNESSEIRKCVTCGKLQRNYGHILSGWEYGEWESDENTDEGVPQ